MARTLMILLGLLLFSSISASAQSIGLYGGYTFEHLTISPARNLSGVEIAAQYRFANVISAVADLDSHFGLPSSPDGRTLHFMVGPEISVPGHFSPFVHVLAGIGEVHSNGLSSKSFSAAFGGGIDMHIAPLLSWRMIQADDVITHFFGGIQHSMRVSTGVVIRF